MADVFISYAREDHDHIPGIVSALEAAGLSVFWDRSIPIGQTWRSLIGHNLKTAKCVLVVWSKASVESEWVQDEADEAKRRRILVPVLLEDVNPPLGFGAFQAADLRHSRPDRRPQLDALTRAVLAIAKGPQSGAEESDRVSAVTASQNPDLAASTANASTRATKDSALQSNELGAAGTTALAGGDLLSVPANLARADESLDAAGAAVDRDTDHQVLRLDSAPCGSPVDFLVAQSGDSKTDSGDEAVSGHAQDDASVAMQLRNEGNTVLEGLKLVGLVLGATAVVLLSLWVGFKISSG